jgi:hypothetical protein
MGTDHGWARGANWLDKRRGNLVEPRCVSGCFMWPVDAHFMAIFMRTLNCRDWVLYGALPGGDRSYVLDLGKANPSKSKLIKGGWRRNHRDTEGTGRGGSRRSAMPPSEPFSKRIQVNPSESKPIEVHRGSQRGTRRGDYRFEISGFGGESNPIKVDQGRGDLAGYGGAESAVTEGIRVYPGESGLYATP